MTVTPRDQRIAQGPPTQEAYERVLDEAATIRMQKVTDSGEGMYNQPTFREGMDLCYANLYRKFLRIQNLVQKGSYTGTSGETLRDGLMDLLNYAALGVQLCDQQGLGKPRMRIDQIAFFGADAPELKKKLAAIFGDPNWIEDHVCGGGTVGGESAENEANLSFSEELCSTQFEVLDYTEGPNWLAYKDEPHGLAHLGAHVEDIEYWREHLEGLGYPVIQELITTAHTNAAIRDHRRYHYLIFDTREDLGFYLKLIQRLEV